jgi:crossover junction endodeoxyribonuclease RuvC
MPMSKPQTTRILAFDTSLSSPGAAIVEVSAGQPRIVALSHVKTDSKQPHTFRAELVEAWATMFIAEHIGKGFDVCIREDFNGQSSTQNYPVFAAWSSIERACERFGLTFVKWTEVTKSGRKKTSLGPSPTKVKLIVCGSGKAEKDEVEQAVRELTGYTGEFAADDESDAAAIALAYAIQNGLIKRKE